MSEHWPDPDLIWDFLAEAEEHLDGVDSSLLELEKAPIQHADASVQAALRGLHSVKGTAGYVSLFDVQEVCHATESLLHGLSGTAASTRERLDVSFDGVSLLRERLAEVRRCCEAGSALPTNPRINEFVHRANQAVGAPALR